MPIPNLPLAGKNLLISRGPEGGLLSIHDKNGQRLYEGDKGPTLFLGDFVASPDSRFALAWNLEFVDLESSDNREANTRLIVLKENSILCDMTLKQFWLTEGGISNTGRCVFVSNESYVEKSYFAVYDSIKGEMILNQVYPGLICIPAISPDGKYAIYRTISSETGRENLVHFFDLEAKTELWTKEPVYSDSVNGFVIDSRTQQIQYLHEESPTMLYDFAGNCLNPDDYTRYRVSQGDYNIIYHGIESLKEIQDLPTRRKQAENLYKITAQAWKDDENGRSFLARALGEMFEVLEMPEKALQSYEKALELDPKAGVIGRAKKLRKQLVKAKGEK